MVSYPQDAPERTPVKGDKMVCIEPSVVRGEFGKLNEVYTVRAVSTSNVAFEELISPGGVHAWCILKRFRLVASEDLKPKGPEPICWIVGLVPPESQVYCSSHKHKEDAKRRCESKAKEHPGKSFGIFPIFGSVYECVQPKQTQPPFEVIKNEID